jgi:hypothetical protein
MDHGVAASASSLWFRLCIKLSNKEFCNLCPRPRSVKWHLRIPVQIVDGVIKDLVEKGLDHTMVKFAPEPSGSGLPLVSGAKGRVASPIRKTRHIVTPA